MNCTRWVHINIPKPVSSPLVFRKLNGGFKILGLFWDYWSWVLPIGHCFRWLLLGVLNQQLCPPPFILVVLRANQWVTHWWNKKLHLNGVKVYFLCNYQWVTHWLALSHLVCRSSHTPRPNHFPLWSRDKGTKLPNFAFKIFQKIPPIFGATHRAGARRTQVVGCLRIQLTLSLDRVASGQCHSVKLESYVFL